MIAEPVLLLYFTTQRGTVTTTPQVATHYPYRYSMHTAILSWVLQLGRTRCSVWALRAAGLCSDKKNEQHESVVNIPLTPLNLKVKTCWDEYHQQDEQQICI